MSAKTASPLPTEEMISPGEAARILGVHAETVRRYIRQGHLPAQHLGTRTLRIKRADIENFTQACKLTDSKQAELNSDTITITLKGSIGRRLQDRAAQTGVTVEEMTSHLLTDFEETIAGIESGYADLDAGRVMDFEQYVTARHERRAQKAAE